MELDVQKYDKIHLDAGYQLAATAGVYVPWFQCTLRCLCGQKRPMPELDRIFCMCVDRGIDTPEDICFVLSLNREITEGEIERLIANGTFSGENGRLSLTQFGTDCLLHKSSVEKEIREFPVSVNAITGEWSVGEDGLLTEKTADPAAICLSPLRTAARADLENDGALRKYLEEANGTNILQLRLMDYKTVAYRGEYILFYQNEDGSILLEIYDSEKEELDLELSSSLRKRYEKREILELLRAEKHLKTAGQALVGQIRAENPEVDQISSSGKLRYVRNQEIRELFINKLDEVETHIFIISPWITDFVVDGEMVERLERALQRGVRIDIGYGYVSWDKLQWKIRKYQKEKNSARMERDREYKSWKMAAMLQDRFQEYENFHIFYVREGTHEKVFCYDDASILIGSLNLLSYDGGEQENYSGFQFRYEGGVLIEDREFALTVMRGFA